MFKHKKLAHWSDQYWKHISRNIGPITYIEQEKIRNTPIGVFGVGGLGGSLTEQIVRAGCEKIVICDNDIFDNSNLNRQICTTEDVDRYKVDVLEEYLKKINPEIEVIKYYNVDENQIKKILRNLKIVALTLDDLIASIIITRNCKKLDIPVLESWAIPCLFTLWFTSDSISYESCYDLKTQDMTIEQILSMKKEKSHSNETFLKKIFQIPGARNFYDREAGAYDEMMSGTLGARSFAPIVRLCASFLAFDLIFAGILEIKKKILAPTVMGYDYIQLKPIQFKFA